MNFTLFFLVVLFSAEDSLYCCIKNRKNHQKKRWKLLLAFLHPLNFILNHFFNTKKKFCSSETTLSTKSVAISAVSFYSEQLNTNQGHLGDQFGSLLRASLSSIIIVTVCNFVPHRTSCLVL